MPQNLISLICFFFLNEKHLWLTSKDWIYMHQNFNYSKFVFLHSIDLFKWASVYYYQMTVWHEAKANIEFMSSVYYSMLLNTEIRFHFNGIGLSNNVNWESMILSYHLSLIYALHCRKLHDMNWLNSLYSERTSF